MLLPIFVPKRLLTSGEGALQYLLWALADVQGDMVPIKKEHLPQEYVILFWTDNNRAFNLDS